MGGTNSKVLSGVAAGIVASIGAVLAKRQYNEKKARPILLDFTEEIPLVRKQAPRSIASAPSYLPENIHVLTVEQELVH